MVKKRIRRRKSYAPSAAQRQLNQLVPDGESGQKYFNISIAVILLIFGIYQSAIYYGHQPVPDRDFFGFINTGQKLLSFQLPSSFKRAPVFSVVPVAIGRVLGGGYPDLRGAWMLNTVLHPLNLLLLWLIGKRILGHSGVWFAIIAILNPHLLKHLGRAIAETTLIFFILSTLYLIIRRSRWRYLFASVACMVRYECAALIMIIFVIDMSDLWTVRRLLRSLLWSALAALPLAIWLLCTYLAWEPGASHYIGHYGHGTSVGKFVFYLWQSTFSPLFAIPNRDMAYTLSIISKTVAASGIIIAIIYNLSCMVVSSGFYRSLAGRPVVSASDSRNSTPKTSDQYDKITHNRNILAMLLFIFAYFLIHSLRAETLHRYCTPISWLALLLCCYGWMRCWKIIKQKINIPHWLIVILQILISCAAIIWFIWLFPLLSRTEQVSHASRNLPYVAIAVTVAVLLVHIVFYKSKHLLTYITLSVVLCLIIVSNHFLVAGRLKNGQRFLEFKQLAKW
ncbi:MAG: hypothetical protein KAT56_06965, partial [Sedimentisphaerales bacterium]|nr:hypothetical protein [Sedimentisphaerales bacterium]